MWREGYKVDVAYTSLLKRAQQTLDIVLKITGQEDVPVHQNWRLNERMYGGLTGLNKKETVEKYGAEQVRVGVGVRVGSGRGGGGVSPAGVPIALSIVLQIVSGGQVAALLRHAPSGDRPV